LRVAALFDIHGNFPALEAVLAQGDREGVDAIVIGGDIAAGPPQPREVVERVRSLPNAYVIRGNADRLFADEYTGDDGLDWLLERLEDDQAEWLANLPFSAVLDDTLYVHAAPDDDRTIVTEVTTDEKLAGLLRDVDEIRHPPKTASASARGAETRMFSAAISSARGWPEARTSSAARSRS
jgi:Icc-related predicted phosphoesterase